jgi:hypothetical protein
LFGTLKIVFRALLVILEWQKDLLLSNLSQVAHMTTDSIKSSLAQTKAFTLSILVGEILFFDYKEDVLMDVDNIKEAFKLYVEYSPLS